MKEADMKFGVGCGKLRGKVKCVDSHLRKIVRNEDMDHEF
jgi:hypothetical protein